MRNIIIPFAILLTFSSCQQARVEKKSEAGLTGLTGNYLGQTPPGD
jgi:hypothetical protein